MTKFEINVRTEWPDQADAILGLIRGTADPDAYASVEAWIRQCYGHPSRHERVALALNELLDGHGVEAIFAQGEYRQPCVEYINQGDTYAATLIYLTGRGWRVSSWGDEAERLGL